MQASGPAEASPAEGLLDRRRSAACAPSPSSTRTCGRPRTSSSSRGTSRELEDEIQASRRIYNSNVQAYNTKIQIFPNSVVASCGGFTAREFFEITDAAEREPVQVSFT